MSDSINRKDVLELLKNINDENPVEAVLNLPLTVRLRHAVELTESETLTEITFIRMPQAGDFDVMPVGTPVMGDFFKPIGKVCGIPLVHVKKLSMPDLGMCVQVVSAFLEDFLGDGEET